MTFLPAQYNLQVDRLSLSIILDNHLNLRCFVTVDETSAVQMKMSVSAEEPTLHWKRKTTMTYHTHILTSFFKLKVAAYIKNTAFLDFAKRKTYFYNFH